MTKLFLTSLLKWGYSYDMMLIDSARTYMKLWNTFKVSPFQSHFQQNEFWSTFFGFLLNVSNWSRSWKTLVDLGLRRFCTQLSGQALPARIIPSFRRKKYNCKIFLLFRKKWNGFRMSSTMGQVQGYAFTSIILQRQEVQRSNPFWRRFYVIIAATVVRMKLW